MFRVVRSEPEISSDSNTSTFGASRLLVKHSSIDLQKRIYRSASMQDGGNLLLVFQFLHLHSFLSLLLLSLLLLVELLRQFLRLVDILQELPLFLPLLRFPALLLHLQDAVALLLRQRLVPGPHDFALRFFASRAFFFVLVLLVRVEQQRRLRQNPIPLPTDSKFAGTRCLKRSALVMPFMSVRSFFIFFT